MGIEIYFNEIKNLDMVDGKAIWTVRDVVYHLRNTVTDSWILNDATPQQVIEYLVRVRGFSPASAHEALGKADDIKDFKIVMVLTPEWIEAHSEKIQL